MSSRWPSAVALTMATVSATASAQQVRELGIQATVTASDPVAGIAGVYGALRSSPRTRVSLAAGAGASGGETAWRGELLVHLLSNPRADRGIGVYGAGGVALAGGDGERGYLVLTLGLEAAPGRGSGWFLEAGVGGGVRIAAGLRWRRPAPAGQLEP